MGSAPSRLLCNVAGKRHDGRRDLPLVATTIDPLFVSIRHNLSNLNAVLSSDSEQNITDVYLFPHFIKCFDEIIRFFRSGFDMQILGCPLGFIF